MRSETAAELKRRRFRELAAVMSEEVAAAAEATRLAASLKRAAALERTLALSAPLEKGDATEGDGAAPEEWRGALVVHRIGGQRMTKDDLPEDLKADGEAVEVWSAAVAMKCLRVAADRWVCGWRMRMIERKSYGGGADLYIRSPDMEPEALGSRHTGPKGAIRSFVELERKLRERMQEGASTGCSAAGNVLAATTYIDPSNGLVRLELCVVAPRSPEPSYKDAQLVCRRKSTLDGAR